MVKIVNVKNASLVIKMLIFMTLMAKNSIINDEKFIPHSISKAIYRVPTRPGKPGKMRVHLENLEISWIFVKFNKYHGKMTCNLEKLCGY